MCDQCLEIDKYLESLPETPIRLTFKDRINNFKFKLTIRYRVFRYTASKKYAAKWEAEHFKPLLDQAANEEPYPWWDQEEKEQS